MYDHPDVHINYTAQHIVVSEVANALCLYEGNLQEVTEKKPTIDRWVTKHIAD